MGVLSNFFKSKPANTNLIKPIPFVNNLWNHEWHSIQFQVAGVTYEKRQAILEHADKRGIQVIFFKKSTYEDAPCIEVYINNMLVGYVPQKRLNEFLKWCDCPCSVKYTKIAFSQGTYGVTINVVFQNIIPISERTLVSESEYLIVGANFECRKNPKKRRMDVIKKMHLNDIVLIERFTYAGSAAYMIVDPKSNLDLGVFSATVAEYLSTKFKNVVFEAYLCEKVDSIYRVHVNVYK